MLVFGVPVVCGAGVVAGMPEGTAGGTDVPTPPGTCVPLPPDVPPGAVGTPIGTSLAPAGGGVVLGAIFLFMFETDVGVALVLPLSHPTETKAIERQSNAASNVSFLEDIFKCVMFLPENSNSLKIGFPVKRAFPGAILRILTQCEATVKLRF